MNRAMDGDIVAVQVINTEEEPGPLDPLDPLDPTNLSQENLKHEKNPLETLIPETTLAPPIIGELNDEPKEVIYGKVVGIVRRSWKQYCGSLDQVSICISESSSSS